MFLDKIYVFLTLLLLSSLSILPLFVNVPALRKAGNAFIRIAERPVFSIGIIFSAVIGLRLLFLPLLGVPVPGIHDEFSYLLMSDTFAHGRLTNPTHPAWVSFETMNVNWVPTYHSIYPPAQGLFLAIGRVLGHPWIGVLLSNGTMCASVVWMLQAWMPRRWAFLAGMLVAFQFCISSYWINGYWGGAVAATGGALVLGAIGRIRRRARVRDALLLGLGIATLGNSRPYEGLVFCLPTAFYFLGWLAGKVKNRDSLRVRTWRVFVPLSACLLILVGFLAYYNWRLTGNVLLFPHILNSKTYDTEPVFLWQSAKPPLHYQNAQFEGFYNGWARGFYHTSWRDAARLTKEKFIMYGTYFFNRADWLLLPVIPFLFRDKKIRLLLMSFAAGTIAVFLVVYEHPHYAAPLVGAVFALVVQALRHLNRIELKGRRLGAMAVRCIVVLTFCVPLDRAVERHLDVDDNRAGEIREKYEIEQDLGKTAGKHLVMVRYNKNHNYHLEWVYNGAEIASAKVLWARELDEAQNERLFSYFKDRQIWLIQPDEIDAAKHQLKRYFQAERHSAP